MLQKPTVKWYKNPTCNKNLKWYKHGTRNKPQHVTVQCTITEHGT